MDLIYRTDEIGQVGVQMIKRLTYALRHILLVVALFSPTIPVYAITTADEGKLKLPDWSFMEGPPLEVSGEWEVIWGALVPPEEFDEAYRGEYFILPGRWSDLKRPGMNGPMGTATFRVRLALPEHENAVAFHMIAAHSAYRIFIDGVPVMNNGTVSETQEGFQANYVSRSFPGKSGDSEIVMQVANFVHAHAGPGHALTLWDAGRLQRYLDTLSVVYGLLTGILFALGLFQLTIFFSDRKDRTNGPIHLWFSLLCFIIVYRVHGAIPLLHEYFPDSGYWDNLRLSYASLYASPAVFLLFFRATFPDEFPKTLTRGIIWVSFLFLGFTFIASEFLYTSTRNFAISLNVATVVYCLIFTSKAALASQPGARAILISNFVFLLTAVHDGVIYTDQSTGFDMTPFGVLVLGLGYSYALMLRLQKTFQKAHQTSAALTALNVELEKKVEERTLAFKDAAAKAEKEADERARFIAAASHDLRQPVHALSLFNETLKIAAGPDQNLTKITEKQNSIIGSLSEMLETMLESSRLEAKTLSVEIVAVSLEALLEKVQDALQPIAAQHRVELRVVASSGFIWADEKHIRRVLSNLVTNAIQATKGKHGKVLVGCRRTRGFTELIVADNGCGISFEDQKKVFDRYTQLSPISDKQQAGLGLGLSIVKELCALMHVDVALSSTLNRGTLFKLRAQTTSKPGKKSLDSHVLTRQTSPADKRLIVLVIDDNLAALDALTDLFRGWGHAARGVASKAEALSTLEDFGKPDLIVTDYRLNENTTGLDVIEAIQRRYGKVKAVIVTGSTAVADLQALKASPFQVFHKPLDQGLMKTYLLEEVYGKHPEDETV